MQAHAHGSWGEFMSVHTAGLDAAWTFVCHHDPLTPHTIQCALLYIRPTARALMQRLLVSGLVWCWWHALALPVTFLCVRFPIL